MSTYHTDPSLVGETALATPVNAFAVKSVARDSTGWPAAYGRIASPRVVIGDVKGFDALSTAESVSVVGFGDGVGLHGGMFVWQGTGADFLAEWRMD